MAKIIDITKKNSHHTEKFSPAAEIVALAGAYEAEGQPTRSLNGRA